MSELLAKLSAPFPPEKISWRVGPVDNKDNPTKGIALAYIDARDVQDRLDEVCGSSDWECEHYAVGTKTACKIGIHTGDQVRWRSDGAGDTDMEADKGAFSDAFKRAAVKWGVGRYLYDVQSPWVAVVKKGKSVVIADHEFSKLQKLLPGSKGETAPAPKEHGELHGPLGKTELKKAVTKFVGDLAECAEQKDRDQLNACLAKAKPIIDQCQRDLPGWYFTKEGSDVTGLQDRIADALAACNPVKHAAE